MAQFQMQLPDEILKDMNTIYENAPEIFDSMTHAGAEVVYRHILSNMRYAFDEPEKLMNFLKITKAYRTFGGKYVNTKVAFYGYYSRKGEPYVNRVKAKAGHLYRTGYKGNTIKMSSGRRGAEYKQKGVPVPLIVIAREFGTSSGEAKKPFVRKAFEQKEQIENAMYRTQVQMSGGLLE